MTTSHMKYKVRPGTIDSGKKYEYKIATLLSLRSVFHHEDMWISSNADGVGAFDDIVLRQGNKIYMLQLKHKDDPKPLSEREFLAPKGDFALQKYAQDIFKLKRSIESKCEIKDILNYLGDFEDIYFVIFTNRDVRGANFLIQSCNKLQFLNTGTNAFVIDVKKVVNVDDTNSCPNMFLLPSQIHAKDIDAKIAEEIRKLTIHLEVQQTDVKHVAEKFTKFVTEWAEGLLGGHYCLQKRDIIGKLTELFCNQHEIKLNNEILSFYTCKKKHIWNKIIQGVILTVVDFEEAVFKFLLEYLSSEIRNYFDKRPTCWDEHFSEQEQTSFYQQNTGLKTLMLKNVGSRGKITPVDVYKCLWMQGKAPLLLKINKNDELFNILRILNLSGFYYKVIVLNTSKKAFSSINNEILTKCFITLKDLTHEKRNLVLEQAVKFQGRPSVMLKSLVNENMLQYIKCQDIINILTENFTIGNDLSSLPNYFISRKICGIFLQSRVLNEVIGEIFLVEETPELPFITLPITGINVYQIEDIKSIDFENSGCILTSRGVTRSEINALKSMHKPIHCLTIKNRNCLEWRGSFGSVENLRKFQVELEDTTESDTTNKFYSSTNLISAVPGMGKSLLMDYMALHAPTDKWVIKIDLNSHQKYYRNVLSKDKYHASDTLRASDHLNYFSREIHDENSNPDLSKTIFKTLLETRDIVVLLDGFDEISISYKEEVTDLAKSLINEGYCVWITTRPYMSAYLEKELNTFSKSLKSFSLDDQKQFLTSYFTAGSAELQSDSKQFIGEFVDKLLVAAGKNLNDWDREFTGIPLQTKLLADAFEDECSNYISSQGTANFKENFDLLYLYENFIKKKIDILCNKYGYGEEGNRVMFKEHQSLFAVICLFQHHRNLITYERIAKDLDVYYRNQPEKLQLLQREGIVIVNDDLNVSFVHRTYGEFLAAQWLAENLDNSDDDLRSFVHFLVRRRFSYEYTFLFGLFDRILAKACPLHLHVINNRIDEAMEMIMTDSNIINIVDIGRRSVSHIVALNGVRFTMPSIQYGKLKIREPEIKFLKSESFNKDKMLELLQRILNHDSLKMTTDVLGYTALDYALINNSLTVAEKCSSRFPNLNIKAVIKKRYRNTYLCYCAFLNYDLLFSLLLPYFASKNVLYGCRNSNQLVHDYLDEILDYKNSVSVLGNDKEISENLKLKMENFNLKSKERLKNQTLLEFLQPNYTTRKFFTDIRYAICFGTVQNVSKLLLKGANINEQDINYNTPLHYAVLYNNLAAVKTLLKRNAHVNKQNIDKNTPLHLAFVCKFSSYFLGSIHANKIVSRLLNSGADSNVRNDSDRTPLHLAVSRRKRNWLKLFIRKGGADVNAQNRIGRSVLHYSVERGRNKILTTLLKNSSDIKINLQDHYEDTALVCAARYNNFEGVKLLICHGANVNISNKIGQTALHCSVEKGFGKTLSVLLTNSIRIDVNAQDNHGNTPLIQAAIHDNIVAAELLLSNGADLDIRNNNGQTASDIAMSQSYNDLYDYLQHKRINYKYSITRL